MKSEIRLIYLKTDGNCHLCGKKHRLMDYAITWQREHHIPKAKGGSDNIKNLFVACKECNQHKGVLPTSTIRKWMGLTRTPLSRQSKLKIREKEDTTDLLLILVSLLLSFFMLMGMNQTKRDNQMKLPPV